MGRVLDIELKNREFESHWHRTKKQTNLEYKYMLLSSNISTKKKERDMEVKKVDEMPHVLVLPYPAQGHINPTLQFAKRLVSKGIKATLLLTKFIHKSINPPQSSGCVGIETISDGYDEGGFASAPSISAYIKNMEITGSQTLSQLIKKHEKDGCPVSCVVYDSFLTWAIDVAKEFGILGATFFTQPCCVNNIYLQFNDGKFEIPSLDSASGTNISVSIPGLPELKVSDLPSFFNVPGSYPPYFEMVLNQYPSLGKADLVLVNTFQELEEEVVEFMRKDFPLRTIGPLLPSMYLDKRIQDDTSYGLNLYKPDIELCMKWLNEKPKGSVVYIAFGSMAELGVEQMEELAWGVKGSNSYFLWVVRASEENKVSTKFREETSEKGLIVRWCPQLDVLAHGSVGCFVTHCGWNSILEGLSLGVPMVGVPQWTDQTTNAKFVEDIWEVGVRAGVDEKGRVSRQELERCIREIMEEGRGVEIKKNAIKWKNLAIQAVSEGGSSDKNIDEFVSKLFQN